MNSTIDTDMVKRIVNESCPPDVFCERVYRRKWTIPPMAIVVAVLRHRKKRRWATIEADDREVSDWADEGRVRYVFAPRVGDGVLAMDE